MEYSSGVWGFPRFPKMENIQNRAARIFLGVHKFAPTLGLEGDLSWLSIRYRLWINMLRMWNRFVILPQSRLTKHVFMNDFYLACSGYNN